MRGVEAVIDKDFASELLAREIDADLFVMATDVDAVYEGWGTADQRRLGEVTVAELRANSYAAGSMGPKVEAAARLRGGDRQARRHRSTRGHRSDRRWNGGHERGRRTHDLNRSAT